MKTTFKILLVLFVLFALSGASAYYYLQPSYSGTLQLQNLQSEVEVLYDAHGVPHIYADNEEDAYRALGYVPRQRPTVSDGVDAASGNGKTVRNVWRGDD